MVCAKDDETICTIRDVRADAELKRFSVVVRPHYTVAALYDDVKLQTGNSFPYDFELHLQSPDGLPLSLHDHQLDRLEDVGIKFGCVNTLIISPFRSSTGEAAQAATNNSSYLTPLEDAMSSDDDLALGASASPVESGNYNAPDPRDLLPPLFNQPASTVPSAQQSTAPSAATATSGIEPGSLLLDFYKSPEPADTDGSKSGATKRRVPAITAGTTLYTGTSGGTMIENTNGYHHHQNGSGAGGGGGGGGGGGDSRSYRGLVNQAMTCYLNSLLQALYMTPEFRNALYNWEFDGEDEAKSIPYQLQKLFVKLQTSPKSAVETTDLTRSFGWDSAEGWQQHDIQELCRVMFDALEHKFRRTKQADLINRLYEGRMIDYVKCLECNTENQREDKFLDIPLPVRPFGSSVANESVEEALQGFVKPEILNESNQYFCDTCKKKCDAHKGLKFTKFPYILTLQLKRFDFDYQSFHRIKLNDKVTFPELLNLNHFVNAPSDTGSSEFKLTTSTIAAAAAAAAESSNGNGSMMMETAENFMKSDECSTTDSGSALEEDAFPNGGGTTLSSATTTPNDQYMQDDDEGIDMCNGDSKPSPINNSFNAPGPYKYELFAIMIHSGSASGGHYYAYIKDFKSGCWLSFNDECVVRITQEDIQKSYGGGAYKTAYPGAYTSSTNAYMLMYRQIDASKNTLPITEEQFPDHIKRLILKIRDNEGNHSRDNMDLTRVKVAYENPRKRTIKSQRLMLFNNSTMAETLQEALRVHHLKGLVPIERCRLVGYDSKAQTIERSFDDHDDKTIDEVMSTLKRCDGLLLEVRDEGDVFEEYLPQGVMTKVYKVDVNNRDVEGPLSLRANLSQTVAQYKAVVARKLRLNPKALLLGMTVHKDNAKLLQNEEATLGEENFIEYCKVFVAPMGASATTTTSTPATEDPTEWCNRFRHFIQRLDHVVSLYLTLPNMDQETLESLSIPRLSKDALASLSAAIEQQQPLTTTTVTSSTGTTGDSNSEDSSLSDNDRTLVEDDNVAPTSGKLNGDWYLNNGTNGFRDSDDEEDDEELKWQENLQHCKANDYFFKVTPLDATIKASTVVSNGTVDTNGTLDNESTRSSSSSEAEKIIQILVDKRASHGYLKYRLQQHLHISMEYFKVFPSASLCPANESSNLLKELEYKDDENLSIELGRVLRKGEYKLNVHYINVDEMTEEMDKTPFLCSWIVRNGQLIGQIKTDILAHLATVGGDNFKYGHLHPNNCRLRRKGIKYLWSVYKDDERIGKDISMPTNCEVFLQEVEDLESVTPNSINDVVLLVRRWYPTDMKLGKFQEILFTEKLELKELLSSISGIPVENIEYVKITQSSQRESVLQIHNNLHWVSTPQHAEDCTSYTVGTLLYYRDRTEPLKQLTSEERKELAKKDIRSSSTSSPRRERALKIYLDPSPKKSDD
ncbi:ubiquitin carboxyl-terminal hydrolase 47 isoform X2 [Anopheles aquasalis]|nr:ubiquitin carboxyl-terminal hydrolase 47 isoform X2 [Anopheles aquasalis]XP_050091239.1 ubiquitin carboxyl-terminal hydrolase 47 isoform X2 [Anopheles aquasalis]